MADEEFLRSLMDQRVYVTLTDSRKVAGTLQCIDNSTNMILGDVEIFLHDQTCQVLNTAMVNGKHIVKIELITSSS
jgi:small nuclear ribonucleoprotein (snRNP)-like protein